MADGDQVRMQAEATLEAIKTAMVVVREDENEDWADSMEDDDAVAIRDFAIDLLNITHHRLKPQETCS